MALPGSTVDRFRGAFYEDAGNVVIRTSGSGGSGGSTTPTAMYNGQKTITTAGTAEAISTTQTCQYVTIKALNGNNSNVYVGNSSVSSANGIVLLPGESVDIHIDDIAKIFIDVDVSSEGITWVAS